MGNSIKDTEINRNCEDKQWSDVLIGWPRGNLSTHSVGRTLPTKTPSKMYSTLGPMHQPLQVTFSNCDISCIMDQSTNKTTNESDFTSSVWEKLCYSGSHAVRLATNHSMGFTQDGQTVSWCCLFWSSVLEKSVEFSFHTFTKSWWIDIGHLFSQISPNINYVWGEVRPHHLGEICPFCLPVTFNTSLTVTWSSGTCWQLKGMGKCWSQPKEGGGVNKEIKEICQLCRTS